MKSKKLFYLAFLFIGVVLVSVMCVSYAFFTSINEEHGKLNIVAGTLDYKIESVELTDSKVTVGFNETKVIDIKLTSLNDVDSKYEIYYNYVTSLNDTEKSRINIGYTTTNKDSVSGTIGANQTKNIRVYITNSNDKDVEISFGVKGGLVNNSLVINEGIRFTTNDIVAPLFDIRTEVIDGKTYAVIDTKDNQSGVKQVEYNGQVQNLPKNRSDYKIYVSHLSAYKYESVTSSLFRYKNITGVTTNWSASEIIAGDYDLVIDYKGYASTSGAINDELFDNGINIVSYGNDTTSNKLISSIKLASTSSKLDNINILKDNIFTRNFGNYFYTSDAGQYFVKFNSDVEVWYQGTYQDVVYDIMGYYNKNNVRWVHNQSFDFLPPHLALMADFLLKINTAQFEITESGDYTFKIVDNVGNTVEKTVSIEVK